MLRYFLVQNQNLRVSLHRDNCLCIKTMVMFKGAPRKYYRISLACSDKTGIIFNPIMEMPHCFRNVTYITKFMIKVLEVIGPDHGVLYKGLPYKGDHARTNILLPAIFLERSHFMSSRAIGVEPDNAFSTRHFTMRVVLISCLDRSIL